MKDRYGSHAIFRSSITTKYRYKTLKGEVVERVWELVWHMTVEMIKVYLELHPDDNFKIELSPIKTRRFGNAYSDFLSLFKPSGSCLVIVVTAVGFDEEIVHNYIREQKSLWE